MRILAATALATIAASSAHAQELNLALECEGVATLDTTEFTHRNDGSAPEARHGTARQTERVQIVFEGAGGRIRIPESMLPNIRGRSQDGWRELSEIRQRDDQIDARFSYNFLDKPTVRIDRVTGGILISQLTSRFTGTCQPYDATARRF